MSESRLSLVEQLRSIWDLGGLSARELGRRVWNEVGDNNLFGRSSEFAYNFLMALFPLLLFLLAILGIFASEGTLLRSELFNALAQVVPASAWDLITKTIDEITRASGGGKITFGLMFFLWSATGGTITMISVLNVAYHVRDTRPWYKVRLIALGLTLCLSVLMLMALLLVLFGSGIADFLGSKLGIGPLAVDTWKILQWPTSILFVCVAFALIYYFGPDVKERHWYWITPGSLAGVSIWLASSFAFRLYLKFFNNYSKTYGSLGAVIVLMLWFYVTGFAFLIGGEINSEIEHAAARRGHPEAKAEGRKAA